eukprot:TRINITY_DN12092_c0_g1_i1.p1 TRINITY_DN12092_c0_g1~~TRINITY_DN12092_c0_g1_i1.p1  ORF type:complete len:91 (-),score=4.59 TRINITY_DN12092_c0_g1_i1:66-338(-)
MLVPENDPGSFNQSLMELGATVCTPAKPQCSKCPISTLCTAFKELNQKSVPYSELFHTDDKKENSNTLAKVKNNEHFTEVQRQDDSKITP